MPKNWKLYSLVILLFVQGGFFTLLFNNPKGINRVLSWITFSYNRFVSSITNSITFPLGEVVYGLIILLVLCGLVGVVISCKRKNKKWINRFVLCFLIFLNIAYFTYSLVWGINYHKETISHKSDNVKIELDELKDLYCINLEKAIDFRVSFNSEKNKPLQFHFSDEFYQTIFVKNQSRVNDLSFVKNYQLLDQPRFKQSNISEIQNYLGILGYYNPFTAEANINRSNTDLKKGLTIFHEYAHQMGFASESEANFIAYYIAIKSRNKELGYAAYYKSLFTLLGTIQREDPYFVRDELNSLPLLIQQDREGEQLFYERYTGAVNESFSHLNDQFLKANAQEGRISYNKYIELIYLLNREESQKKISHKKRTLNE